MAAGTSEAAAAAAAAAVAGAAVVAAAAAVMEAAAVAVSAAAAAAATAVPGTKSFVLQRGGVSSLATSKAGVATNLLFTPNSF